VSVIESRLGRSVPIAIHFKLFERVWELLVFATINRKNKNRLERDDDIGAQAVLSHRGLRYGSSRHAVDPNSKANSPIWMNPSDSYKRRAA